MRRPSLLFLDWFLLATDFLSVRVQACCCSILNFAIDRWPSRSFRDPVFLMAKNVRAQLVQLFCLVCKPSLNSFSPFHLSCPSRLVNSVRWTLAFNVDAWGLAESKIYEDNLAAIPSSDIHVNFDALFYFWIVLLPLSLAIKELILWLYARRQHSGFTLARVIAGGVHLLLGSHCRRMSWSCQSHLDSICCTAPCGRHTRKSASLSRVWAANQRAADDC